MRTFVWLLCSVSLVWTYSIADAQQASANTVGSLLDQADVVIVADVANYIQTGQTISADLLPVRVIKGSVAIGAALKMIWYSSNQPDLGSGLNNSRGIWFLQQDKQNNSQWNAIPVVRGVRQGSIDTAFIRLSSGSQPTQYPYADSASPKTKLAAEIASALQDPQAMKSSALTVLQIGGALNDLGLDQLPGAQIAGGIISSGGVVTPLAGVTLSTGIRAGSADALKTVAALNPATLNSTLQLQLSLPICMYRNVDPVGVQALGQILSSQHTEAMKNCAVHALQAIHTKETLPYLLQMLNGPTSQTQYEAVVGIAKFAAGMAPQNADDPEKKNQPLAQTSDDILKHFPAMNKFNENPAEYISYWRQWLSQQGIR